MNLITIDSTEVLIAKINTAHAEAQAYAGKAVERALEAGDLLLLAKSQVAHGQWLPWLQKNCPAISERTAQNYMRVAKELPIEKRNAADLTMREALRLVAGELPALEHQPEILAPWWETQTPELNAAYCADGDMLGLACVWMDSEGVGITEIAARLGTDSKIVNNILDPQIPNDLYLGAGEEAEPYVEAEMRAMWNAITRQAQRNLIWLTSDHYRDAARLAAYCKNIHMETKLSGIAEMHSNRCQRIPKTDDDLIRMVAMKISIAAVRGMALLPAAWMEIGIAAIATERTKPKWLDQFAKAVVVWDHCVGIGYNDEQMNTKPFHLAIIHECQPSKKELAA